MAKRYFYLLNKVFILNKKGDVVRSFLLILVYIFMNQTSAQIVLKSIEKLDIPGSEEWFMPIFSPDGSKIYITNTKYNGIWEYDLVKKSLRQITSDPGSGYDFDFSDDGQNIVYRKSLYPKGSNTRLQEIYSVNLRTLKKVKVASGDDLTNPTYIKSSIVYGSKSEIKGMNKIDLLNTTKVIGIELGKIVIFHNGEKKILDPLGTGSYIWPTLSPDKTKLVAVSPGYGAFICDIEGNVITNLGKANYPQWTRDGKWIIYMDDIDDGHFILSSEIMAIYTDGKQKFALTSTPNVIEMYPSVSPKENKIVCSSLDGTIYLLTYNLIESNEKSDKKID